MRRREGRVPLPEGFGVIWTTVAVDMVGFGIVIPILGLYAEDFGATPASVGLIVASFSAAQLVFSPIMGWLSDRIGRKPVLVISLLGSAVGSLVTGLAGSLALLYLGRIIDGASGASVAVARASVADLADAEERPRLMGLLGAAFGIGFVAGPAIGALAALGDPRLPFFLAAVIATVNAMVAIVRLPETRHPGAVGPATRAVRAASDPIFAKLLLASFLSMTAFSAFEAMFPLLGERRFDFDISAVGIVFAAIGVALIVVQTLVVGPVNRKLGELGALRLGLGLNGVGLLVLAYDGGWFVLGLALVLLVLGQGLAVPTLTSAVAGEAPAGRIGAQLGWQQATGSLARIVGPVLAGALMKYVGVPAPFVFGAVLAGLAVVALPSVLTSRRETAPTTNPRPA